MPELPELKPKISEGPVHSPAAEYRNIASALVEAQARQGDGRQRAAAWAARRLGVTTRRVLAVVDGEVRRVWADEWVRARQVYRDFLAEEERRSLAHAALLALERSRLDQEDAEDGAP